MIMMRPRLRLLEKLGAKIVCAGGSDSVGASCPCIIMVRCKLDADN